MLTAKTHTAYIKNDGPEYNPDKFVYLEGPCKKCGASNNTLIILSYKSNQKERGEGIFNTTCLVCNATHIYYHKNVDIKEE